VNQQSNKMTLEIDKAFTGNFTVPDISKGEYTRILLATCLSIVPAILYFIIVAVGVISYLYVAVFWFPAVSGSTGTLAITGYCFTVATLTVLMIFLIRPFFTVRRKIGELVLESAQEQAIFNLFNLTAKKLNVPSLHRIRVNSEVVVDANYDTLADAYHKRLTLTLGLPLLSVLSTRECVALVSHALGHFSHPKVSLCYFVIRAVKQWFHSVVHNEDGWENRLEATIEKYHFILFKMLFMPAYFGVIAVNRLFSLFLNLVEAVSNRVVFDMEYRADVFQASVQGSHNFDRCLKHLVQIDQAYHAALEKVFSGESVPANLNSAIYQEYARNPVLPDQFIELAGSEYFNGWQMFPSPISRKRRVEQQQFSAIFDYDKPLSEIFTDLDALASMVTENFYQKNGIDGERTSSARDSDAARTSFPMVRERTILKRYSSGLYRPENVWELPELAKFENLSEEKIIPFLNKVILSIRHSIPDFSKYTEFADEQAKQKAQYHLCQWLVKDGSRRRPDIEVIEQLKFGLSEFERKHGKSVQKYRKFYGSRLVAAMFLGRDNKVFNSALKLARLLSKLALLQDSVNDARVKCSTLEQLLVRRAEGDQMHQKTISRLTRMVLKVIADMEATLEGFSMTLIGKDHPGDIAAGRLDLEQLNGEDYERVVADRFSELVKYFEGFNTSISAKLAQFVEVVERKNAIEPVVIVNLKPKDSDS